MCKDPADRQSDWDAIIQDIIRVQSGELPEGNFRRPLPSTVQRCHLREKQLRELYHQLDKQTSRLAANPNKPTLPIIRRSPLPVPRTTLRADNKRAIIERTAAIMLLTLVLGLSGMIIYRRVMWNRSAPNPAPALPEAAATANDAPPPAADEQRDRLARELYDDALQWLTEHPARFDEAIRKFDRLAADTKGTPYASMAMEQAKKLRQGKARAIKRMLQSLQDHAEQLGARHHYAEAAVLFSEYKGEFAKETYKQRQAQAEKWQARAIAHQQEKQTRQMATESQWSQVLAAISDAVLTEKFDSIAELLQTSFADSNLAEHRLGLREMESYAVRRRD